VADEQRAAVRIKVGFIERERFADPQPGAPEHDDDAAQPDTVGTISGSAHHGDDLLHARRVRRIRHQHFRERAPSSSSPPATSG
jgi:hypothetical protein